LTHDLAYKQDEVK